MQALEDGKYNRALIFLAAFLCAAYLFPYHVHPFRSFYNDWLAIVGVLIAVTYYLQKEKIFVLVPWISVIPIGLAIVIGLQVTFGLVEEGWEILLPGAYFILAAITVILGSTIAANQNGSFHLCFALALAYLFAGLVSVVIASLQLTGAEIPFAPFMMLMPHGTGIYTRPHANIAQPNQLALLFCIAITAVWWLFQIGHVNKKLAAIAVLSLLWGLAMTQSRIGWIIIPLFALLNQLWQKKQDFRRVSNWFAGGVLVSYAMIAIVILPLLSEIIGLQTPSAEDRVAGGIGGRIVLFQQALHLSLSHPWFGVGWFQFGPQQLAIASDFPASVYSHHAHNIFLNFAAELGWPISILVFGVVAYWFQRVWFSSHINKQVGFAIFVFLAMLIHSLVEYPLWYAYFLLPLALLIGMVHQEQFGSKTVTMRRRYLVPVTLMMTVGIVGIASDYRRVVNGFWAMEMGAAGLTIDQKNTEATVKPSFTVFPYMYDYFQLLDTRPREGMKAEEIAFMERTAKRFGGALVLTRLSQVYALNGRDEDAVKTIATVQRLHPDVYKDVYNEWRHAPMEYQHIFRQLPSL